MNENQLLEAMISAPITAVTPNQVEPIVARGYGSQELLLSQPRAIQPLKTLQPTEQMTNSSLPVQPQSQVFMDSSYGYVSGSRHEESEKVIPNYRLATSCANCAFSTYDPVRREATCQKWKVCVTPFYVCDFHLNPSTLAETQENFSETAVTESTENEVVSDVDVVDTSLATNSKYADIELYAEALTLTPSYFDIEGLAEIYSEKKYQQLFKAKHGAASPYLS
jgi:hypothetical protein